MLGMTTLLLIPVLAVTIQVATHSHNGPSTKARAVPVADPNLPEPEGSDPASGTNADSRWRDGNTPGLSWTPADITVSGASEHLIAAGTQSAASSWLPETPGRVAR